MITENGSIKVTTEMNAKVQKEFSRSIFVTGLVFTILGGIGVALFLVLDIVAIFLEWEDDFFVPLILLAGILGCGIGLLGIVKKAAKNVQSGNRTYTYEFFKDYFTATETLNGEIVSNAKFYNGQVIKSRETKNYLFFYVNAASACPVEKQNLTEAEINTLRRIFRLPVKGSQVELKAEILPSRTVEGAPVQPENPNDETKNAGAGNSVPQDPFDDFSE